MTLSNKKQKIEFDYNIDGTFGETWIGFWLGSAVW
jgi:hypothetical protein